MSLNQVNKKLITIVVVVLIVFLVFFIGVSILNSNRNLDFATIEKKMENGAKRYLKDNPELLPSQNGEQIAISVTTLEDGNYIPMMSKMVQGDTICNGEVRVTNNGGHYVYFPYLNCGDEYVTVELYKKIIDPSNIVTQDDGLYQINGEYVYRGSGKKLNNYVSFAGKIWRIVKVDKDNHIKITLNNTDYQSIWDERYNIDKDATAGINDFAKSALKEYLLEMFDDKGFLDEELKGLIVYKQWCIGKRRDEETDKSGAVECSVLTDPMPVGLIQTNEFLLASLDANCVKTISPSCQNYNYLAEYSSSWWTMNAYSENNFEAYRVDYTVLSTSILPRSSRVRPTLYLSNNVVYHGGTGTIDDPYIVK